MKLSLSITDFTLPGGPAGLAEHLTEVVTAADEAGLDTVWVPDHLLQGIPGRAPTDEMLEAYTTLGFLAARSRRVRLGTLVSAVTFRPPTLLIKAVSTLDVLSGGRARLGIGAGYLAAEAAAMGLPLPPTRERFEHLEDTLVLAGQMFAGDDSPFVGRRHRPQRPINSPPPARRPLILVGGSGPRHTLRLVAQYADACNLFDIPDGGAAITRQLEVLAEHCAAVGRDPAGIEKTVSTRIGDGEPAERFIERCRQLCALGIEHAIVLAAGPWSARSLGTLAAARPVLQELG